MFAPIAVFAFNRPAHIQRSLSALAANDLAFQTRVVIFCDAPRTEEEKSKTDAVRHVCRGAKGFKSVELVERESNMGCGKGISAGLREFFSMYPEGIVVEDDIILAPNALRWFNICLGKYRAEPAVFSIAGWSYPGKHMPFPDGYDYDAYFLPRFQCWGWASWADRIQRIDWEMQDYDSYFTTPGLTMAFARGGADLPKMLKSAQSGKTDTWDIQAAYTAFKHGQLVLAPRFPYATNIGTVGEGTHVDNSACRHPTLDIDLSLAPNSPRLPDHVIENPLIMASFLNALHGPPLSRMAHLREKLKRIPARLQRSLVKRKLWPAPQI